LAQEGFQILCARIQIAVLLVSSATSGLLP